MRSSTLVTPTLSVAAAVKVTLPDTVLLGRSYGSQRRRGVRSHVLHRDRQRRGRFRIADLVVATALRVCVPLMTALVSHDSV
jgi:hypothetical protein